MLSRGAELIEHLRKQSSVMIGSRSVCAAAVGRLQTELAAHEGALVEATSRDDFEAAEALEETLQSCRPELEGARVRLHSAEVRHAATRRNPSSVLRVAESTVRRG